MCSSCILVSFLLDKPGKPGVPEIKQVSKTQVTLSWTPPKDTGGCEITEYIVEHRAEGNFKWKRSAKDKILGTVHTVKGLEENTVYEFRVSAVNRVGTGPHSEVTLPVKAEERVGEW
jgi:titin